MLNGVSGKTLIEFEKPEKNGIERKKIGLNNHYQLKNGSVNGNGHIYTNGKHVNSNKQQKTKEAIIFENYEKKHNSKESFEKSPILAAIMTAIGFYCLLFIGYINTLLFSPKTATERNRKGYAPLFNYFDKLYSNYVYRRVRDCWNRPICSVPADTIVIKNRFSPDNRWTFEFDGTTSECINLGSYNYLGFAQNKGPCAEDSIKAIQKYGIANLSPRIDLGTNSLHGELEALTAQFFGVEDAIVFGMGFATNSLNLPSLLSTGCLVISDEKNHASIIVGLKLSGATVKVYKHNNSKDLERVLEDAIIKGQKDGKPWKKALIVLEGVFSMEGSIVHLPEIVAIKKKYGAYLYLDEAHSVGATGPHGRGVTEFHGVDPKDIDILMGTFTKSFGSAGGYIAGKKELIDFLRVNSHAHCYASSMSPAVAQQIITSMRIIMGLDGSNEGQKRIEKLARNTRYFRRRIAQMGVIIFGHEESPVVPMLVYLYSKISFFARSLLKRNIAVVGAGFPAVPLFEGRIRFCMSAAHTKDQLDYVLDNIAELIDIAGLKHSRKPRDPSPIEY